MQKPFIEFASKDFILHPFEIPKPEGYNFPKDFPDCCISHTHNLKLLEDCLDRFPNCCETHIALHKKFQFDKHILYEDLPKRVLKTVEYTEYRILKAIENEDWFDDITEYFEYAIRSLGQPAIGLHIYTELIELFIKNKKTNIPNDKKNAILNYFVEQNNYTPAKEKTDMNLLVSIFEKWITFLPLDLPFFAPYKSKIATTLPFIKGIKRQNRYLGEIAIEMVTPTELVDSLYQRTIYILSLIDTVKLVQEDKIDNAEKTKIDFINQTHQHKQKMLLSNFNTGEKKYIKTIKKWLENEKEYFSNITPVVSLRALPAAIYVQKPKYFLIKDPATRHHKAQALFDQLVAKKFIDIKSKADFKNAFLGSEPTDKIIWIGGIGDLQSFIKYSLKNCLIEKNNQEWVTASNLFTLNGEVFTSRRIKDTKKTSRDLILKKLVQSIF